MQCTYIKANNQPCKAHAMKGSEFCFTHNPETRDEHAQAVVLGGLNSSRKDSVELPAIDIRQPNGVVQLLEETINGVRDGSIPPKVASTVGYLAGHLLKAIESADLDKRLEVIERVILDRKSIMKGSK